MALALPSKVAGTLRVPFAIVRHRRAMLRCEKRLEVILCHAVQSLDAPGLSVEVFALARHDLDGQG
jgi:hypothetical protein